MARKRVPEESAHTVAPSRRSPVRRAKHSPAAKPAQPEAIPAPAPAAAPGAPVYVPNRDETARLAYAYWQARGGAPGSAEDDWFRAERELSSRLSA